MATDELILLRDHLEQPRSNSGLEFRRDSARGALPPISLDTILELQNRLQPNLVRCAAEVEGFVGDEFDEGGVEGGPGRCEGLQLRCCAFSNGRVGVQRGGERLHEREQLVRCGSHHRHDF